jgi:hypothetical protein
MPTQVELSEAIGPSRSTIQRHLSAIDLCEIVAPQKLFLPKILGRITEMARMGDIQFIRLYLKVV